MCPDSKTKLDGTDARKSRYGGFNGLSICARHQNVSTVRFRSRRQSGIESSY